VRHKVPDDRKKPILQLFKYSSIGERHLIRKSYSGSSVEVLKKIKEEIKETNKLTKHYDLKFPPEAILAESVISYVGTMY